MSSHMRTFERRPDPGLRPQVDRPRLRPHPPALSHRELPVPRQRRHPARWVQLVLLGSTIVAIAIAIAEDLSTYVGLMGTWPISQRRVDAQVLLLGVHPPSILAPSNVDPDHWLLGADPSLAAMVVGQLRDEAALRLVAIGLGGWVTARRIAHTEASLRSTPTWAQLGESEGWSDDAWRALATRCAWQQAALDALPPPPDPTPAQLLDLYHRQYRGAPSTLGFARVKPALTLEILRDERMAALERIMAKALPRLRTIVWDRILASGDRQ